MSVRRGSTPSSPPSPVLRSPRPAHRSRRQIAVALAADAVARATAKFRRPVQHIELGQGQPRIPATFTA